jgi:hypothetical protein
MCPLNVSQHPFMARCFPGMTTRKVASSKYHHLFSPFAGPNIQNINLSREKEK